MIYVVGAVCFDVIAERDSYIAATSNPARITARLGGVAFNIFSRLSKPRKLVTALGDDTFSQVIEKLMLDQLGSFDEIAVVRGYQTPSPFYVAVMESGELKVAASQMDVVERALDRARIEEAIGDVASSDFIILDANLSVEALSELFRTFDRRCKIVFEPISVVKTERHRDYLRDFFLITPNEEEFGCLFGRSAGMVSDADVYAFLDSRCIEFLLRTRGKRGAILYGGENRSDFSPFHLVQSNDTTGAGDLLTALIVDRLHCSFRDNRKVRFGDLAAIIPDAMHAVEQHLQDQGKKE